MEMDNKAKVFWDRQASRYDATEKKFDPVYNAILAKTKKYLGPDDRVLDFGCATGTKAMELAGVAGHVHGLDISPEMINFASKKRNERQVANVSFSHGTIFTGELEKESFDKIIAFSVIHLLEDSESAVGRIHELLRPGGLFIQVTACFREKMTLKTRLGFALTLLMKRLGVIPLHLNMFSKEDVEKLVAKQGFQIVESERIFDGMTASFLVARK
jgi:ubiquinone/menaquinone biosynthesis C-methylase UbiE